MADGRRDRFLRLVWTESGDGVLTSFARSGRATGEIVASRRIASAFAGLLGAIRESTTDGRSGT